MEDNTASSTSTEVSPAGVERVDGTATAESASSTDSVVSGHLNGNPATVAPKESSDESTAVLSDVREVLPLLSLRVFLLSLLRYVPSLLSMTKSGFGRNSGCLY